MGAHPLSETQKLYKSLFFLSVSVAVPTELFRLNLAPHMAKDRIVTMHRDAASHRVGCWLQWFPGNPIHLAPRSDRPGCHEQSLRTCGHSGLSRLFVLQRARPHKLFAVSLTVVWLRICR